MIAGGAGGVVGSLGKRGDGAWFQNRRRRGELDFRCHDGGVSGVGGGILDANITPLDGVGIAVENDFRLTDVLHARGCANAKLEQFAQNALETVLQGKMARGRDFFFLFFFLMAVRWRGGFQDISLSVSDS